MSGKESGEVVSIGYRERIRKMPATRSRRFSDTQSSFRELQAPPGTIILRPFASRSLSTNLHAQVTTATLSGIVKDDKGAALGSVTVTVEYPDAGISQTLSTKTDGRFTVSNLRVGGPYRVTGATDSWSSSGSS